MFCSVSCSGSEVLNILTVMQLAFGEGFHSPI